ncbi:MAG: hydroxymethylglutaryl-CoA reductase [Verrucomicrobiota bacterium]
MPHGSDTAKKHVARVLEKGSVEELRQRLEPRSDAPAPRIPGASLTTPEAIGRRWKLLENSESKDILCPPSAVGVADQYKKNIENYIGELRMPVGLAGPLRVNGLYAQGDFYLPLATTEAALVASYARGCLTISEAGGCTSVLLMEGVSRAPGFAFRTLSEAGIFVGWLVDQTETLKQIAGTTTNHGQLEDVSIQIEGNHAYLILEYTTGDAAGQNMVTIATQAVYDHVLAHSPVAPAYHFIEANMSGDKKASAQSFQSVRGKKVSAEVRLDAKLLKKRLRCTAKGMENYWRMSALGGVMSGTIGVQGHYANGLAALYLATGQDVACVAESAVGVTRFEANEDGSLYASVTLPNLIVGTVGGGTGLPTQRAGLEMLGLAGAGNAKALAEVCAGLALAGEISIIGALAAGEFSRAHQKLARGKGEPSGDAQ